MPLIVIEGVDGSGKTTLVQNFRQVAARHCLILSRSGPPKHPSDLLSSISWINRMADSSVPIIVDRHPLISEPIYGPIVRGSSMIEDVYSEDQAFEIIANRANRIIFCRTDLDTSMRASRRERQMEGVHEQYGALYQKYDHAMARIVSQYKGNVVPYDWTFDQSVDFNQLFFGSL